MRRDIDRAIVRYFPALLASSAVLILIGKPLVKAASLAVGVTTFD